MSEIDRLNQRLRTISVDLDIDFYAAFKGREEELYTDGVHPNAEGYDVMERVLTSSIEKIK